MTGSKEKAKSFSLRNVSLFSLLFIDAIGVAIVAPLLAPGFFSSPPHILAQYSSLFRHIMYGVLLSLYSLFTLFSSSFIGGLSDKIGRKKVINACLIGLFVSYVLLGLGIVWNSLTLLIVGRIIGGFTAASQAVGQAAILDESTARNKSLLINLCLLTSSLGFVAGPIFSGILSNSNLISWFNYQIPLYAVALLSVINFLVFCISYKQPVAPSGTAPLEITKMFRGVQNFTGALKNKALRRLIAIFALMQMGWGAYFLFLPVYLVEKFHFNAAQTGALMSVLGLGFCVTYGTMPFLFSAKWSQSHLAIWGLFGTGASLLSFLIFKPVFLLWIFAVLSAIFICVAYSALIHLFTDAVDSARRGWVLGIATATVSFSWVMVTLVMGITTAISSLVPMVVAFICILLSGLLLLRK